jgi:hypothetical protein
MAAAVAILIADRIACPRRQWVCWCVCIGDVGCGSSLEPSLKLRDAVTV